MQSQRGERLLGGLTPRSFLARHWQRRPLLVRAALDAFQGLLSPRDLMRMAARDDTESRVVTRASGRWQVHHGPFNTRFFRDLGTRGWTLLVQDVNHILPQASALLHRFSFVPHARLDDLMVSYAPPGGGVGPHFDSYDVFLLQGLGRRRWRVSTQRDLELVEGAPLKLLARFRPHQEWVLQPADMLYLPPRCAHDGVAVDECMTYSIGFRAPSWQELGTRFLAHLDDHLHLEGMYADPDLAPATRPGRIGADMLRQTRESLARIRWSGADVLRFLGCYLSEPKPHVLFAGPKAPAARAVFLGRACRNGLLLSLKTRMLYAGSLVFINGECVRARADVLRRLQRLADARAIRPVGTEPAELVDLLHRWYRAGYLELAPARLPHEDS